MNHDNVRPTRDGIGVMITVPGRSAIFASQRRGLWYASNFQADTLENLVAKLDGSASRV